ncbi:hypothetical protein ACOMHN_007031 [Nucella lapillus]
MTLKPGLSLSPPSPGRYRPTSGPAMPAGGGEWGAGRAAPRRGIGQSAGVGGSARQALESARAAYFFPELSLSSSTSSPLLLPVPGPVQHGVDTLITDSNGNTSRYDSSERILAPPSPHTASSSPSPSPSGASSSARLSGHSGSQRDSHHYDRSSSSGSRADTDPFYCFPDEEVDVPGRYSGAYPVPGYNDHNDNSQRIYNLNDVGMSPSEGSHRRSQPGTPAWRSSQGTSPKPTRRGGHPRPHSNLPARSSHSFSASTPTHRRPVRRRSSTSSDEMSQESPLPTNPSDTPFPLNPDVANLQGHSNNHHHRGHYHTRAASFRDPKTAGKQSSRAAAVVEESVVMEGGEGERRGVMGQARRNSMPNVNNLLNVPGASSGGGAAGSTSESPKETTRIRRVRSFKTTSKGGIVNRGDSFKKKSTHSLMSTGSTVTDSDVRARLNSGNNNSLVGGVPGGMGMPGGVGGPSYFRVKVMGAAGVGKTSMAHQFLTSESVDHDDADSSKPV